MLGGDLESLPAGPGDVNLDLGAGLAFQKVGQSDGLDGVTRSDAAVIRLVGEPEGEDTLFLFWESG